jgi:hypothetical protein
MPVSLLYCEGGPKSADLRVLSALLAGVCAIKPGGSKYGFGQGVRFARMASGAGIGVTIAGLRDRDFDANDTPPTLAPRRWLVDNNTLWLGWYWERVEIENYLVDPEVVKRALGTQAPNVKSYQAALRESAESIAAYTAARTALSLARVRFSPLQNAWGKEYGTGDHRFPDQRAEADCRAAICAILTDHEATQSIPVENVLERFDSLLPACRPGGGRFAHFLTFFSGKDLLLGMQDHLTQLGLGTPGQFRERILKGIEQAQDDVWNWLPEWKQLRTWVRMGQP